MALDGVPVSPSTFTEHAFTEHLLHARHWSKHSPQWHFLKYNNVVQGCCQLQKCFAQIRKVALSGQMQPCRHTAWQAGSRFVWRKKRSFIRVDTAHAGHMAWRAKRGLELGLACPSSRCAGWAQVSPQTQRPQRQAFFLKRNVSVQVFSFILSLQTWICKRPSFYELMVIVDGGPCFLSFMECTYLAKWSWQLCVSSLFWTFFCSLKF